MHVATTWERSLAVTCAWAPSGCRSWKDGTDGQGWKETESRREKIFHDQGVKKDGKDEG